MDPTMRPVVPGPAPAIPGAPAGPAVPEAGAAPQQPQPTPALNGDQAATAANVQYNVTQVDIDGIDLQEFQALDGMLQNFMQDGQITAQEWATYDKTRVFYAGGPAHHPTPAPAPTGGSAPAPATPPSPPPTAWEVGTEPITGRGFSSVGDPHETTGDGKKFDNMKVGDFIKLASASGDFVLQTRQEPWAKNPKATVNTEAAVKLGKDVVAYNGKTNTITINGQAREMKVGEEIKLPDGGTVRRTADGVSMTSAKGDKVNILDRGTYIDVGGEVSAQRKDGEIRGSLGAFDADSVGNNDMLGRSGNAQIGDLDKFLEEWRVKGGEGLIPGDPPGGGARDAAEMEARRKDEAEFNNADVTKGGWLSGTEVKAEYKKYDQNNDGEITKDEFMSGRETERAAERDFMVKNVNEDGYLDGNEISADIKKYDKDGNGRLTKEELIAGRLADRKVGPVTTGAGNPTGGAGPANQPGPNTPNPNGVANPDFWMRLINRRFKKRDKNEDGVLTGNEIGRKMAKRYDKNKDGKVDKAEFEAGRRADFLKHLKKKDVNNDGVLSGNELTARVRKRDANGDGQVTAEEYLQGAARERLIAASRREMRARSFRKLDANNDGRVSRQEFLNRR